MACTDCAQNTIHLLLFTGRCLVTAGCRDSTILASSIYTTIHIYTHVCVCVCLIDGLCLYAYYLIFLSVIYACYMPACLIVLDFIAVIYLLKSTNYELQTGPEIKY
jgi:hypothetical protein